MKAVVTAPICPLRGAPTVNATLEDEALCGMVVDILEEPAPGWCRIRTHYRYEGIVSAGDLSVGDEKAAAWEALPKLVVRNKNFCDVLSLPKVQGVILATLPRGAVVSPLGEAVENWQKVLLPDGTQGYVPRAILGTHYTSPCAEGADALRAALVDAAALYAGTHYRWGGKTPQGIDCSGLTAMVYLLCGIAIYRDADIVEGFPIHEIALEDIKPGDLLFFPGHVAMYIGNSLFCHSTARSDACGFTVNSLDPEHPLYNEWLHGNITQVGSYF